MREIIKYIADDGTIFEFEDDCLEYELNCKAKGCTENDIQLWDANRKPLEFIGRSIERVFYINFGTRAGWDAYTAVCDEKGYCSPEHDGFEYQPGLYFYKKWEWVRWQDKVDELMDMLNELDPVNRILP